MAGIGKFVLVFVGPSTVESPEELPVSAAVNPWQRRLLSEAVRSCARAWVLRREDSVAIMAIAEVELYIPWPDSVSPTFLCMDVCRQLRCGSSTRYSEAAPVVEVGLDTAGMQFEDLRACDNSEVKYQSQGILRIRDVYSGSCRGDAGPR